VPVDVRKLSFAACALLVVLRLSIGWQFFYEGVWKLSTYQTATPWSAAGYLKNAKGPFRDSFRNLVEDPDDLDKLDYDKVTANWQHWRAMFLAHHPDLTEAQIKKFDKRMGELEDELKAHLTSPENAGIVREKYKGTIDYKTPGEIELYQHMLERYAVNEKKARVDFQQEHLDKQWAELQEKRKKLVDPVNSLTKELHTTGLKVLTVDQLSRGPSPLPVAKEDSVNRNTIYALIVIGFLLIAGLFSRPAAFAGACLLTLFYLSMPPWPGVPEAPGPEHSLIVNKNFIEIIALLALAAMPSGRWMGFDALIRRFVLRRKTD
jgi:uncharacterized membrane protein YphA (DoxX/SURF4 family)